MTKSITVRPASIGDVAHLVHFNSAMATESEDKGLDPVVLEDGIRYLLAHPKQGFYLIAETDGVVVGALLGTFEWSDWRNGRFWWIQSVYVDRSHRRRGVYSALHSEVRNAALADAEGCGIRLYVEQDNSGAQETYRQLGMSETRYRIYEEEF